MKKARIASQSRDRLDERLKELGSIHRHEVPHRGWIKAIRDALGMTTAQLAGRLGIKQPSVIAIERSEAKGSIELATLRRVAEALDCRLVYALVPKETLEATVRARARAFARRHRGPIEHSMKLENQEVREPSPEAALDVMMRETNPRLFWD